MSLLLPLIGVTDCSRAIALVQNYPSNIVGTFWVMSGYSLDADIPSWWIDIVLEDNQAQAILDTYERGFFSEEHDEPLYLGFCIIVTADKANPANVSYVVQHLRMTGFEGVKLLKILAEYNIPAITEVSYPISFLRQRYGYEEKDSPESLKNLYKWSAQVWEDYYSYLMAAHGQKILQKYWSTPR